MKRSIFLILVAVSTAVLLLAAAGESHLRGQPQLYTAVYWFGGLVAIAVFGIMLSGYYLHSRRIFLYLGAGFLAAGVMDVWIALSFSIPGHDAIRSQTGYAIWMASRLTLGTLAVVGFIRHRTPALRSRSALEVATFTASAVLWASILIFLASTFPLGRFFSARGVSPIVNAVCTVLFAVACVGYSRASVHRGNLLVAWMTYGFMFATFGQLAIGLAKNPVGLLFGFSNVMKVLGYLTPLAGLLAEQSRLQRRLHRQSSEFYGLMQAQQAVVETSDPLKAFQKIVEAAKASLDAQAACLMVHDRARNILEIAAHTGFDNEVAEALIFRPAEGAFGSAFATKATIALFEISEDSALTGKLGDSVGLASVVCAPLVVKGEATGVLGLFFEKPTKLTKEQMRVLDAFAGQAGLAIENLQVRGQAKDSLKAISERTKELEIVYEVSQAITSKLELHELVDTLAEKLKSSVQAHACSVLLFEPDNDSLRILGHNKLSRYVAVEGHVDQCDMVAVSVAKEGKARLIANVPNSLHCKYPDLAGDDGGKHHLLSVPMFSQGVSIGAINVFRRGDEPFGEREKRLMTLLANVVAVGIANSRRYEYQKRIADSLQSTFAPKLEIIPAGTEVYTLYRPGMSESDLGGDFYDIIHLGGPKYALVIGDVAGKGLDAAVYTGMSRYMVQAYSHEDPDPVSVITRVNNALCRYTPTSKFVTMIYGVFNAETREFTYVNAGHELPLLFRQLEGNIERLNTSGPAVGALTEAEYASSAVILSPGDALVFYTDGATDARKEGKFLGTEGLEKIVASELRRNIGDPAEGIFEGINSYANGYLRDDVAILIVKVRKPGSLF
ncbi:MAG: SpoIIE family protein phosphatase [Armatimonadetes bacterium]|nr:SpoIIE family protein phosphatase [Armatimonadota bacterium]